MYSQREFNLKKKTLQLLKKVCSTTLQSVHACVRCACVREVSRACVHVCALKEDLHFVIHAH